MNLFLGKEAWIGKKNEDCGHKDDTKTIPQMEIP